MGFRPTGRKATTLLAERPVASEKITEVVTRIRTARRRSPALSEAYVTWRPTSAPSTRRRSGERPWKRLIVTVEPTLWTHGASLPSRLDAGVPADRVVPMPRRSPEQVPTAKTNRSERVRARFKH
jgi:hypothetical protein